MEACSPHSLAFLAEAQKGRIGPEPFNPSPVAFDLLKLPQGCLATLRNVLYKDQNTQVTLNKRRSVAKL
jgi:hypothetical protein